MNIKPHINSIAVAACICLFVTIGIASFMLTEQSKRIQSLQGANSSLTSEVITYRNENGKLMTEKHAAEVRSRDIELLLPQVAESIKKDFDLKMKNMRAYMQAEFQARGSGNATITIIDTVMQTNSSFNPFAVVVQDGYLDLQADVYDSLNAPYDYTYSDTLKYAFHMKGKFLQKKKLYGTGMLSNPNAQIINSEAVLVNEFKDKRWGVGPYIGWGVTQDLQTNFTVGVSVHYSLFKF